jgi:hypothetical protein
LEQRDVGFIFGGSTNIPMDNNIVTNYIIPSEKGEIYMEHPITTTTTTTLTEL